MYALIPIPFAVFSVVFLGIRVRRQFAKVQKMYARISGTIQENIMGQRVLKAFHREENAQRTVEEKSAEMRDANIRLNDMSALINPLIQVCFGVSFLISLTYGSNLVLNSTITVGELVSFNEYLTRIMRPVVSLGRIINATARGMASYRRLRDIIQQPEISPMEYEYKDMELTGAVSVRNLSYTYPGTTRQVLKDVSFELPVGKVIGVVGETGCGKTTLIDLLLKLRTTPDDTVFLDGHPLQTVPARTVRSIIGYVPQEEFLFNTTVRENIRFYEPATEPALQEASRAADLAKDMAQLAEGMDTEVGERGRHLSGGQKKRVTIARALVRDPKLLIFDDVLSSVDVRTEREILENLRQIMAEKTCLIVSQRISALRHADEILYMEHGTIAERGTHEELLALGGRYAALHEQQAKAAEEAEAALRQ
jgi:ATP-binding cassette subfamily B protein